MKVLAVAHDPGGANAVAATVAVLREGAVDVRAYAKGPGLRQFAQLRVECSVAEEGSAIVMAARDADVLLTGTSAGDELELRAIAAAKRLAIPSVALIDYPANYRQRFERRETLTLPDVITALDASSTKDMIADGLPRAAIQATGQPYFGWLLRQRGERGALGADAAGARDGRLRLLFASEPGELAAGALECLLETLGAPTDGGASPAASLTLRFHPRQSDADRERALAQVRGAGVAAGIDGTDDTLACLASYDAVIGITSTILVEGALLGVPTASILAGGHDPLHWLRRGLVPILASRDAIAAFVRRPTSGSPDAAFRRAHLGADDRAAGLCRGLARRGRRTR